ncbi:MULTISPECIES: hypothetical protein [unclassified Microcoleus]|uniref:hypothetical protein n=1 Tax=unclassified Microcoleus TaxID=2642155 RepID=UPI002FCF560B
MLAEGRRMKEEGRRKKEEGRRKKEEGRRKKEEGKIVAQSLSVWRTAYLTPNNSLV